MITEECLIALPERKFNVLPNKTGSVETTSGFVRRSFSEGVLFAIVLTKANLFGS